MSYRQLAEAARGNIGPYCKACPVCDGRACKSAMPGPGSKGSGTGAARNYEAWQRVLVNMDTIHAAFEADTSVQVLGQRLSVPVMIAPVGDVKMHYGERYDTFEYNEGALRAAAGEGTLALTGDGVNGHIFEQNCEVMERLNGRGIPTIKPWDMPTVFQRLELALAAHPTAIAMDIDAAGLPILKGREPMAGAKDASQLAEIASACHDAGVPFVLKGVMTPRAAEAAASAGADAVVVSNHGGRVLDGVPATADVLPGIVDAVGAHMEVLVDGGLRSGLDVFRALALGARACLMCRPFVVAMFGGGEEGVRAYIRQLKAELADVMEMCGAATVDDIRPSMVFSAKE